MRTLPALIGLLTISTSLTWHVPSAIAQTGAEAKIVQEFNRAMELKEFAKARELAASLAKSASSERVQLISADLLLRSGDAKSAVKQFDGYIAKRSGEKPYLWQRGIALYFAGRYKDGVDQFKVHREVNPKDVENAAWHFLCLAKLESPEKARGLVLPAPNDPRPPMKEILEMLKTGDTSTVEERIREYEGERAEVIAAFYGNLYLGLHADALGNRAEATKFMKLAVKRTPMGYMGDVARVYLEYLESETKVD
ncbi:MAG: tetratricopeptide repeat protein [Planctomycetota bacterium]